MKKSATESVRFGVRAVRLAAALALPLCLAPSPLPAERDPAPDHVVLATGHYIEGTATRINDRQIELSTLEYGRLLIPLDKIAAMSLTTPREGLATTYVDPSIFSEGAAGNLGLPAIPPGAKLFSVMPGEASSLPDASGAPPAVGPLNPLDGRQYVSPESTRGAALSRPRDGYHAVVVAVEGGQAQFKRGDAKWSDLGQGSQVKTGDEVKASAKLALRLRGGRLLLAQPGAEFVLDSVDKAEIEMTLKRGHVWLEGSGGRIVAEISTPQALVSARSGRFAVIANGQGTQAASFDGPASLSNQVKRSRPLQIDSREMAGIDAAGNSHGPSPLKPSDAESYRNPSSPR